MSIFTKKILHNILGKKLEQDNISDDYKLEKCQRCHKSRQGELIRVPSRRGRIIDVCPTCRSELIMEKT